MALNLPPLHLSGQAASDARSGSNVDHSGWVVNIGGGTASGPGWIVVAIAAAAVWWLTRKG